MPEPFTVAYLDHTAKLSGGEIALLRLLESLDPARVTPLVVLAEDGPLRERLEAVGIECQVALLGEKVKDVRKEALGAGILAKLGLVAEFLGYSVRLAKLLRARRVQVVHTNSLKADIYGGLAASLARIPLVWHVRDHIDPGYLPGPVVKVFRALARRWPRYVVAISQSTLDRLFPAPGPSVPTARRGIVHDGLAASELGDSPESVERKPWSSPVRVGIVGRLTPWKGQHIFLEAARQTLASGADVEFFLAGSAMFGEDDYEAALKKQVADAGVGEKVKFLGFVDDVPGLLDTLDILVHASTTPEPFGQVVIEGMAEGLPVIATDGGGVKEIVVDGESGLLVPMGDAAALAAALQALLADPEAARKLGRAGYLRVRRHFTAAQTARKIERVYADILGIAYEPAP